jgi:hypothetical protein
VVQNPLELLHGLPDLQTRVVIEPRQNDRRDPVDHPGPSHLKGGGKVRGTIVNAGQDMAMKINHEIRVSAGVCYIFVTNRVKSWAQQNQIT